VLFDIDGDGIKDRSAWISGQDALLAIDSNENGQIDGVHELFGGLSRGDGYAKLADLDSNGDGFVNADDQHYASLKVWQDTNMDGLTDEGEMSSAAVAGLNSISLEYQSKDIYQNNNLIGEISDAVVNGKTVEAADIYFKFKSGTKNEVVTGSEIDDPQVGQVNGLISAIATFSSAAAVQTALPANYQAELNPILAASWV